MESEILAAGAAGGLILGEAVDYLAARVSVAQANPEQPGAQLSKLQRATNFIFRRMSVDRTPPVSDWSVEDELGAPSLPEIPAQPYVQLSKPQRMARYIGRHASFLAIDGAAFGLSIAALASPATTYHTDTRANIGIAFDASGQTANAYGNGFAITTEQNYYQSLVNDPKLKTYSILSQQNTSNPASPNTILNASPLGGSDLDNAVNSALPRDKAVVLITSGGELNDSTNDENSANAAAEHVFVIDVEQGTDLQLVQLAASTGGQYYNAGSYSPASVEKAVQNIELPVQPESSILLGSDNSIWFAMSCVTFAGLAVGAWRRSEYRIQWKFNKGGK